MSKRQAIRTKGHRGLIKPGEVKNPNGRPKLEDSAAQASRDVCNGVITAENATTPLHKMYLALLAKALEGDVAAIKEATARAFGGTVQKTEVTDTTPDPVETFRFRVVELSESGDLIDVGEV